jgi:hypothetical protein
MGSACNNSASGNYFEKLTPDTGIVYTGPTISALNICTGDKLNEIEAVLLQKIIDYSTGVGISISSIDLTTCQAFASCISCCGTCTDLPCLLECYKNTICSIWGDVETLKSEVTTLLNGPYDTGCLTVVSNPTLNQIVQELILEFCNLVAAFNVLDTSVAGFITGISDTIGNFLNNALSTCQGTQTLIKSGSGGSFQASFKGFVPIGAIIPYAGPTAGKFDATGLGLSNTDVCGFALCNGNNGTVDMREQVPVGCGAGVMGGSTLPINASGANYALRQLVGQASVTLTSSESGFPGTGVTVNDLGHFHHLWMWEGEAGSGGAGGNTFMKADGDCSQTRDPGGPNTGVCGTGAGLAVKAYIDRQVSNISINATPQNAVLPHENRQPSRALLYIQRIS